ncbi:aminodeoxychorismate/anthranilate synthase component II [Neobacillus sp. PS3-34]|uniref:anthranilate synthase component II n=1 Tax=Neobacillus sp. PS3-34 TaxID=3070678 RepID=UPI0027E18C0B|nr:aminodeoxychorismate/anthranilate synthase component II [Neobacillus sp. PS3-34]WML47902.1 aminodeoxychorismate/anthranilate synthase component II [Neobacillus sp. PS3-34]
MILLIDNFDSFTYNLYQFLGELGETVQVSRNNQITIEEIKNLNPSAIILSPGPGRREDAGICLEAVSNFYQTVPILGICLGHQTIAHAFGGVVSNAKTIKHGKTSLITHNGRNLFAYLTSPLEVMRYHSLSVQRRTLPPMLECIAISMEDQEVMAIRHQYYPVYGLQFHPESIGTPYGKQMILNFLKETERMRNDEEIFAPVS